MLIVDAPDPSLGKGHTVRSPSSGTLFGRRGDSGRWMRPASTGHWSTPRHGTRTRTSWRSQRCANTPAALRSWAGSISTTRRGATSSRTGRSGGECSASGSTPTSGTRLILVHRRHARLAVARRRARPSAGGAGCGDVPAGRGPNRRAPPRLEIDRRPHGRAAAPARARRPTGSSRNCWVSAKLPNVAVKATGAGRLRRGRNTRSAACIRTCTACFDAFGPERTFWGTDITRMPCSWRQCVTLFTEELPWLKGRDLDLVMGEALCNWIGWPLPAGGKR